MMPGEALFKLSHGEQIPGGIPVFAAGQGAWQGGEVDTEYHWREHGHWSGGIDGWRARNPSGFALDPHGH